MKSLFLITRECNKFPGLVRFELIALIRRINVGLDRARRFAFAFGAFEAYLVEKGDDVASQ